MANNEYSSDELNPPTWLNKAFFELALRKFKKDDTITVDELVLRPGTKPGEHYSSIMFRAEVMFSSQGTDGCSVNIKLILKTVPIEEGHKMDLLKESTLFKTEMRVYKEILPEMQRLLASINDTTTIAPTCVYQSNEPAPVIIFIDEAPNGFTSYKTALTYDQSQVLIERIAKFHACSVYMNQNGFNMSSFDDCPFLKEDGKVDLLSLFYRPCVLDAIKSVQKWEECKQYSEILEKSLLLFEQRMQQVFLEKQKQPYQVLVHGDFQFLNMLARNGGLKHEDFFLLDYQYCYWNSPAIDVICLLTCCCDKNTRLNHREEVIRKYFDIFQQTLVKLNYKKNLPRLLDLQVEMLRCGLVEVMFFLAFTPFQMVDFSKFDLNKMMATRDFHGATKEFFDSKEFKEDLLKRLNFLIEMGVLE